MAERGLVSVVGAARILGVHPNTVRAWTEQGRLPAIRINARGDRRYRIADLGDDGGRGPLVSVAGAARTLGIPRGAVRAWTDQGRLPAMRINARGDRRFRLADLEETMRGAGSTPTATPEPPEPYRDTAAPLVSAADAARILGVHPNTVRAWTEQGRLPAARINTRGDRRYRLEDIEAFLIMATATHVSGGELG